MSPELSPREGLQDQKAGSIGCWARMTRRTETHLEPRVMHFVQAAPVAQLGNRRYVRLQSIYIIITCIDAALSGGQGAR